MDIFTNFFSSLYEWFGLNPLYRSDMGSFLRGFDVTCTNYSDTDWYSVIGFSMIGLVLLFYVLQYHLLDRLRFFKRYHWWIFVLILISINFIIAFTIPYNSLQAEDYCNELKLSVTDCIGFGFSNALWSLIFYIIITSFKYPRYLANNCRYTTFWKP